ncbi:asparagine synthase (glutamine-hydrolyzing) [Rhizobium sp. 007]|uniref:asparagine synthase (glutamine-hydrolyzing) n=1 Tax=Rhizobium sp. 007 TaxID=2785056 RepID=UPI00188FB525|nr:asparagine synthase (glutamine-hydrolyzing) [Rhizobium sp. 007]QPB24752.1 asparagine synthase (glutamine-hydrolyzing) [Rhizobium sp. 007]
MCGIAGWIDFAGLPSNADQLVETMNNVLARRGPDGSGVWRSEFACLGHRRLSVIDLEGGAQPMELSRERGSITLTYNGEIYNYRELRQELLARGHTFKTQSDTEVLLAAWSEWGYESLGRLNGMFSFALWDASREELWLLRDHLGIKPLYYHWRGSSLLFASEVKALFAHPSVHAVIDAEGVAQLLLPLIKFPGANPYKDVFEVLPGSATVFSRNGLRSIRYWNLEEIISRAPPRIEITQAGASLRGLLIDTIERQTIADVPLCTLLSGGLDSSAITAGAQKIQTGNSKVRSFSVDFNDAADSQTSRSALDRKFAHEAAAFIGSEHRNIVLDTSLLAAPETRDACVAARDLPNGIGDLDLSLLLLCRKVREHATVALSGESADELLAGYLWFQEPTAVWADTFPWLADSPAHGYLHQRILNAFQPALLAELQLEEYLQDHYSAALSKLDLDPGLSAADRRHREIMYLAVTHFLPTLLDRNDRLSMATGLEVRVPFCDHRIVEHLVTLPAAVHTADGREKSVLRQAAKDMLPVGVLERKKSPYPSVPDPTYSSQIASQIDALTSDQRARLRDFFSPSILDGRGAAGMTASHGLISNIEGELVLNFASWFTQYNAQIAT